MNFLEIIPESLKSLFGLIDKMVPSKDKAAELKVAVALSESNSQFWFAANWRPVVMMMLAALVGVLEVMGREVPIWIVVILCLGLVGHIISKENVDQVLKLLQADKGDKKK